MKKFIVTLLIFITPYLVNAQSTSNFMKGKIGISLYGGVNIPVSGDYSSTIKTTDYLKTGSQFALGVSYFITKGLGFEGTLSAGYNHHTEKFKPAGKNPMWVNGSASINAIYNFGHLVPNWVIEPIVRAGVGSYSWEHFEDGLIEGGISKESSNHSISSFGYNFGVGAEYYVKKNLTIGLLLDYNIYHPKYEDQVNTTVDDRTTLSFFSPQVKLSYYFPTRK